jgi:hypothetical protein
MRRVKLALPLAAMLACSAAHPQSIGDRYLDRPYWQSFDWNTASESAIWRDTSFRPYVQPTPSAMRVEKNQKLEVAGRTFVASLAKDSMKLVRAHITTLAIDKEQSGDCALLERRWSTVFGEPAARVSNRYFLVKGFPIVEQHIQWLVGSTSVSLECSLQGSDKKEFDFLAITYRASEDTPRLEATISLLCKRSYSMTGSSSLQSREAEPQALTIIPIAKLVADAELVRLGDVDAISPTLIELSLPGERINSRYRINRVTGALTGSAISKDGGRTVATYSGECETRTPGSRKF